MKSRTEKPVKEGDLKAESLKKEKLAPVFRIGKLPRDEAAKSGPRDARFNEKEETTPEPVTGLTQPLKESIPYEEERRSYIERRQPTSKNWKGAERRQGSERRKTARASSKESSSRLAPEVGLLIVWFVTIIVLPGLVFWRRGWEASLAAFGIVAAAFLTHYFFHLNRRN